jgi:hypothetical protein
MISGQTSKLEVVSASLCQGGRRCPLGVKSGRDALKFRCPLYPRKRTFITAIGMSALGHKRTHAAQQIASYSITSSAIASTPDGLVRPNALAVLRLMTSSTFVDCSTGKSAGFAPLRIFPVPTGVPLKIIGPTAKTCMLVLIWRPARLWIKHTLLLVR